MDFTVLCVSGASFVNVDSFRAFRTIGDFKGYLLALCQGLEIIRLNPRVMDEYISAFLLCNESVAFGLIEPLTVPLSMLLS